MSEIADAMQELLHNRLAELGGGDAADLEARRGAIVKLDGELAQFHGRNLTPAEMVRFQGIVNKRNQAYDMMAQLLQKQQQALNSVVQNMR
jgi:hypothetical protein